MATKEEFNTRIKTFLKTILASQASAAAMEWIENQEDKLKGQVGGLKFFLAFSQASKHFSKQNLQLTGSQSEEANSLRTGFHPQNWNELQTARTILLLCLNADNGHSWEAILDKLFETGDMHEQEALYAALPILPYPELLTKRASEGLRTNITSIFDAIALDNPFPAEQLKLEAWNQMVLKAIFMQRPLYRILKADERANKALADTLVDFVHERWSAGREVMPELWRFVGPFLDEKSLPLMQKVLEEGNELEKQAAALACHQNQGAPAKALLQQYPEAQAMVDSGKTNWTDIGIQYYEKQYA